MDIRFLFRGMLIGFSIAAPVGPIGVLCIRRTLSGGQAVGFVSGLGAATADAFYGCVAGFGLTVVSNVLIRQQSWLRLIGGIFLCYLGIRTLLARTASEPAASTRQFSLLEAYASTLALTLANPLTILSFAAIFAGLGLAGAAGSYMSAAILVAGVFCGSSAWWLFLSAGVGLLRHRCTPNAMRWVNRLAGLVVLGFGVAALFSLLT